MKTIRQTEFGDWQTPDSLANLVCKLLVNRGIKPLSIFEPNCGKGVFLRVAKECFSNIKTVVGLDINPDYVNYVKSIQTSSEKILCGDFFKYDWENDVKRLPDPILVIGNPPWVTNSELMRNDGSNLPKKTNINGVNGINAITGKGNFDISEWMLIKEIKALQGRDAILAMLCKTGTARKVISYAWSNGIMFTDAEIREIDARKYFDVAVQACLLIVEFNPQTDRLDGHCRVFSSFESTEPLYHLGLKNGRLVSNIDVVEKYSEYLTAGEPFYIWRSGIKHDCADILELKCQSDGCLLNGLGEKVQVDDDLIYPMLKSSDLANGRIENYTRMMIITQKAIGEDTNFLKLYYPSTWSYLEKHEEFFVKRKSSIYKNRPRFSIFGIGDYTFKPWKIAISGLYKNLKFQIIPPFNGKPVVFDDTCYFLSGETKEEIELIYNLLGSDIYLELLKAHIFWDSKRPVTAELLNSIDILAIASLHGMQEQLLRFRPYLLNILQATLF